jgi:hypothetical protein
MTERATQLSATAEEQIVQLLALISRVDDATARLPCPGREKLGDGTIAAAARHTAENYQRIAAFVQTSDRMSSTNAASQHGGHRIPRFLRALGHEPQDHSQHGPGAGQHADRHTADNTDPDTVIEQLAASRAGLDRIADLADSQLDSIPPKDSFRFCDGQRTLEQVLTGLLKHQGHQVDALKAAIP